MIRAYQACVATTVRQFEGFIARYVGDGVLTYFGWPEARETDAERAVRAGLAVAAAVAKMSVRGELLQVRIGIATGLVIIGEPIGSGDSRQQTAVGETPNLAARLQGLAGPGQVVIDATTRRQIGGLFECQNLGTVELKGLPAAVPAWQVVSENHTLGQFEALRSGATPLIGRDEEMELLLRRWEQAKTGKGRVVLISAEPGVGKSRLAEALAERIAAEPHISAALFLFAAPSGQCAISSDRTDGASGRLRSRGWASSQARQIASTARRDRAAEGRGGADRRPALVAVSRSCAVARCLAATQKGEDVRGAAAAG